MSRASALLPDLAPLRRHRSFRLLWFGQLVSNAGTQMRLVALPYQVYVLTGSPFQVGLLGLFQAIPLISLPLIGQINALNSAASRTGRMSKNMATSETVTSKIKATTL